MTPTRKTPPLLPARRARLQAAQEAAREALRSARPGRGHVLPRTVDTAAIDAAWPAVAGSTGALEVLAAMVRARKTGRALPTQAAARAGVVKCMVRIGVRELRLGDVRFQLGEDHAVQAGEGHYVVRSGALRVTVAKPAPRARAAAKGVNLGRVREVVAAAATAGADVISLAERRARRTA